MTLKTKLGLVFNCITTVLLLPILLIQSIWIKLTALRLPEPSGERSGHTGEDSRFKLLIIGDSAAAGVGVKNQKDALSGQLTAKLAQKDNISWKLIAKNGFTSSDIVKVLNNLNEQAFDYVLVSIGVNDVIGLTRSHHWTANIKVILNLLKTKCESPTVLMTNVPPMQQFSAIPFPLNWVLGLRAKKLNKLMAQATQETSNCSVLTFDFPFTPEYLAQDCFHPSKLAYGIWANQAIEKIEKVEKVEKVS